MQSDLATIRSSDSTALHFPLNLSALDHFQTSRKILPIIHCNHTSSIQKQPLHLLLFLKLITARISNSLNVCTVCSCSPGSAILNSNTLLCSLPHHLHSMKIDSWIRL